MSYANMMSPSRVALEAAYAYHLKTTGLKSATLDELAEALGFVCDDGEGGREALADTIAAEREACAEVVESQAGKLEAYGQGDITMGEIRRLHALASAIRSRK